MPPLVEVYLNAYNNSDHVNVDSDLFWYLTVLEY